MCTSAELQAGGAGRRIGQIGFIHGLSMWLAGGLVKDSKAEWVGTAAARGWRRR